MSGADRNLETLAGGGAFFECPRWHDGHLWVSDYWASEVVAISPDGTKRRVAEVAGSPAGLGWLPDGTPLVVSIMDRRLLRVQDGTTVLHADLSEHAAPQANDMVVDASGRAYVGTIDFMAFEEMPTTNLLRVDPDGTVSVAAGGIAFPNGMAITPDGSTLIVAESWAQRLTAFDIAPDGSLSNRRAWAEFAPAAQGQDAQGTPGQQGEPSEPTWSCAPDGISLDTEGALWVADAANKRAIRVREGGEILEEISTGALDVVACTLGGEDGRTLFLCTTTDYRIDPEEAVRTRPSKILTARVEVPHAGRP